MDTCVIEILNLVLDLFCINFERMLIWLQEGNTSIRSKQRDITRALADCDYVRKEVIDRGGQSVGSRSRETI
jgi:hypothetical protein